MPDQPEAQPTHEKPITSPEDAVIWWQQRLDTPRFVYFIQDDEGGPVKIGEAFDPFKRLRQLQCGNPRPLNLRAVVLATEETEAKLHRAWAPMVVRGEWFGEQDEIIGRAQRTQRRQIERAEGIDARSLQRGSHGIAAEAYVSIRPATPLVVW